MNDKIGSGKRTVITGKGTALTKKVIVDVYDDFPSSAFMQVEYINNGTEDFDVTGWVNNNYRVLTGNTAADEPPFWSYQSASHEDRRDWILPLQTGYKEENYLGMNDTDYGGGTPVIDIWRKDAGISIGHVEMDPKLNSLLVTMPDSSHSEIAVTFNCEKILKPGDSFSTFRTFVTVHKGDYFAALVEYRRFMMKQGVTFDEYPASSYEPIWCAWGYGRNFTMEQVYNTLPKAKELGFQWAVLDDGWQTAEGDSCYGTHAEFFQFRRTTRLPALYAGNVS